jgi:hypothetical protein
MTDSTDPARLRDHFRVSARLDEGPAFEVCFTDHEPWPCRAALLERLERAEGALRYFTTDFLIPDTSGRWGLPVTVHLGESETEAENRVYDVETTLTTLAASEPPAPEEAPK